MDSKTDWIVSSSKRTILKGLIELFDARPVLYALVKRELKSRYRGSIFGFTWALGKPLSMLLIFYFVIGEILGASRSIEYFALYIFIGLMFWGFFAESVVTSTNSIVNSSGLIQKVAFPREILPLNVVIVAGVNTLIQTPVLIFGYLLIGRWPTFEQITLLIPILTILVMFTLSLALLLSALNVYVRDIQPLTELTIMLLMYASPIIYSWTFVYENLLTRSINQNWFIAYMSNPLATVITGIQDALWPGVRKFSDGTIAENFINLASPYVWLFVVLSVLSVAGAYKIFLKLEPNFAREL